MFTNTSALATHSGMLHDGCGLPLEPRHGYRGGARKAVRAGVREGDLALAKIMCSKCINLFTFSKKRDTFFLFELD